MLTYEEERRPDVASLLKHKVFNECSNKVKSPSFRIKTVRAPYKPILTNEQTIEDLKSSGTMSKMDSEDFSVKSQQRNHLNKKDGINNSFVLSNDRFIMDEEKTEDISGFERTEDVPVRGQRKRNKTEFLHAGDRLIVRNKAGPKKSLFYEKSKLNI